jgi:hypothetical protein
VVLAKQFHDTGKRRTCPHHDCKITQQQPEEEDSQSRRCIRRLFLKDGARAISDCYDSSWLKKEIAMPTRKIEFIGPHIKIHSVTSKGLIVIEGEQNWSGGRLNRMFGTHSKSSTG